MYQFVNDLGSRDRFLFRTNSRTVWFEISFRCFSLPEVRSQTRSFVNTRLHLQSERQRPFERMVDGSPIITPAWLLTITAFVGHQFLACRHIISLAVKTVLEISSSIVDITPALACLGTRFRCSALQSERSMTVSPHNTSMHIIKARGLKTAGRSTFSPRQNP